MLGAYSLLLYVPHGVARSPHHAGQCIIDGRIIARFVPYDTSTWMACCHVTYAAWRELAL
ncbi:hypothetical protein CFR74_09590 [Novacetimonas hansenii]|nr:hypothetical protein CFR74_09590 [Novacetimonas hansenii]